MKWSLKSIGWILFSLVLLAGCSPSSRLEGHLKKGESYIASGELAKAQIELENARRLAPGDVRVLERIARVKAEQGSVLQAVQMVQRFSLPLKDPVLRLHLADFYLQNGAAAAARTELLAVLDAQPSNAEALLMLCSPGAPQDFEKDMEARIQALASSQPHDVGVTLGRGALALRKRDLSQAEQLTRQAIEKSPNIPRAYLQLAHILTLRSNRTESEKAFAEAARRAPARSPLRTAYGQSLAGSGDIPGAQKWLQEQLLQAPDYLPAMLAVARVAFQQKSLEDGLKWVEKVLAADPLNFEARLLRSEFRLARGESQMNAAEWERFDGSLAPNALVKLQTARAFAAAKASDKAYQYVRQSLALSSNRLDSVALESLLLTARLELDQGQPMSALEAIQRIPVTARALEAKVLQIDALRSLQRWEEAAALCRSLEEAEPRNGLYPFLLGTILRERGQNSAARTSYLRSLQISPANLFVTSHLVDLELSEKNYPQALAAIRAAEVRLTNSAVLKLLEGRIYASQTQWGEAENVLRNAIKLDADLSGAYQLLSSMHVANTNWTAAAQEMETLVGRQTNNIPAWMMLGMLFERMGEWKKGAEVYEKVLTLNPQFVPALNNLAGIYADDPAQLTRALTLAELANKNAPDEPAVSDTLGWIRYRKGDFQGALPLLRFAADRMKKNAEVQYHLGMTLATLGQAEEARAALELATRAPESFRGRTEAEQKLSALRKATSGREGEGSVAEWEKALSADPQDVTTRLRLASHYSETKDYEKAARQYDAALSVNSKLPQGLLRLAELYAGPLRQPQKAIELARRAYDAAPRDGEAAALLGRLTYNTGDYSFAYSLLQSAGKTVTRDDVQMDLCRAAYAVGRLNEAEQIAIRLAESPTTSPTKAAAQNFLEMHGVYANPALAKEPGSDLARRVDAQLAETPDLLPAIMAKASLLRSQSKSEEAQTLYERALQKYPRFAPAMRELAFVLAARKSGDGKAYEWARKARETLPNDLELARLMGKLAYQRGEYDLSAALMQSTERQRPGDPEVLYYWGMSQWRNGQESEARETLRKALALGIQEPLAAECRKLLNTAP